MRTSFNFSEADIKEALADSVSRRKNVVAKPEDVKLSITLPSQDGPIYSSGGVTAIVTPSGSDNADNAEGREPRRG